MTLVDKATRTKGLLYRNLFSGLVGLAAAIAFTVWAIRGQGRLDTNLLAFCIYAFPLPAAIGLAVGFVAPRKAIVWAPLWSCILTALAFALISGCVSGSGIEMSVWRITFMAVGILLAGLGGLAGELANERNYTRQSTLLMVLMCVGMLLLVQWHMAVSKRVFEKTELPKIAAALDRDYMETPADLTWQIRRNPKMGLYTLKTVIDGSDLEVAASARDARILGVEFEIDGHGQTIKDSADAKRYLKNCGFRDKLLTSLSKQEGERSLWCASLEGTRLTLSGTGDVKLEAVPEPRKRFIERKQLTAPI
ncbi:MAG: hypothetical protein ABFD49_07875 [Armatimonadota bacterium]|nr:hypothetical protein [bacterium]